MPSALVRNVVFACAFVVATATIAGCSGSKEAASAGKSPRVVAAISPLAEVARRIGGTSVQVETLAKPGIDPHDAELTSEQIDAVLDADVVVYIKGFQPSLDAVIERRKGPSLDALTAVATRPDEHPTNESAPMPDPHVWLDPQRFGTIATAVARVVGELFPDQRDTFAANAASLNANLNTLDKEFASGLQNCERRTVVTAHEAFGYLTSRYNLEQASVSGLTPDAEPLPDRMQELADLVEKTNTTTVFAESQASDDFAAALAREAGVRVEVLSTLESYDDTTGYEALMRKNLEVLRRALACS